MLNCRRNVIRSNCFKFVLLSLVLYKPDTPTSSPSHKVRLVESSKQLVLFTTGRFKKIFYSSILLPSFRLSTKTKRTSIRQPLADNHCQSGSSLEDAYEKIIFSNHPVSLLVVVTLESKSLTCQRLKLETILGIGPSNSQFRPTFSKNLCTYNRMHNCVYDVCECVM